MKKQWIILISLIAIVVLLFSARRFIPVRSTASVASNEQPDTSLMFVKHILNCTPTEVAGILGNPDSALKSYSGDSDSGSGNIFYMPHYSTTYQNKKYWALYSKKNQLKFIQIQVTLSYFNDNAIQKIGFPHCEPSCPSNDFIISWRGSTFLGSTCQGPLITVKGMREICVNTDNVLRPHDSAYINVEVEPNYDNKF